MDLIKIIPEIHTLTTGIYYEQLKELLDFVLELNKNKALNEIEISYKDRKKYKIFCKEVVYRECKKIGEYFDIPVLKCNNLSEKELIVCINIDKLKPDLINYC